MPAAPPLYRPRFGRPRRVVVADGSMRPTLEPGDRLRVEPRAYEAALPEIGAIVVLEDPEDPDRWLVKRVHAVDPVGRTVDVRGDAADVARDSRSFGPVPLPLLRGRVTRIYFPPERARDL